jgi:sodium transport system permease protein
VSGGKPCVNARSPGSADALIVFLLALTWTTVSGRFLEARFGVWASALFSAGLGLVPVLFAVASGFRFQSVFRLRPVSPWIIAGSLMVSSGMLLFVSLGSMLIGFLFPEAIGSGHGIRLNVADGSLPVLIVSVVVLPALCEELVFRGVILSALSGTSGKWRAILLCGILFGMLHLDPIQFPFTASVGVALSWVVLETGSIVPVVLMHGFHNLVLLLCSRWIARGVIDTADFLSGNRIGAIVAVFAAIVSGAVLLVSGICLIRGKRRISESSLP